MDRYHSITAEIYELSLASLNCNVIEIHFGVYPMDYSQILNRNL